MSYFDTIKKPESTTNAPIKKMGSYFSKIKLPPAGYVPPPKPLLDKKGRTILQATILPGSKFLPDDFIQVGQDIKVPFIQKGITVTSGGAIGKGYSLFKSLIEAPEKMVRSLTEIGGITKQKETKQYRVPSYSETAGKETGQLIDEGIPTTAAVILGSSVVGGEFANDALIFDAILGSVVRGVATKVAKNEAQTLAYDFFGKPKTLVEAEKSFKTIQKEYHPDISGSDIMSKQANNAITILRKEGIPSQSVLKNGVDALLNRPLSSFFKKGVEPTIATKPIKPTLSLPEKTTYFNEIKKPEVKQTIKEIEPSVMQIVDVKTGGVEFKTIPKGQLQEFHNLIDDTQKGIAGKEIDGKVYHLTAKTPEAMERAGAINSGVANISEVPVEGKPEIVKVSGEQLPVGTGETKVSSLEARMKGISKNITPDEAKELGVSTYQMASDEVQLTEAAKIVEKNVDDAVDMLFNKKPTPPGMTTNAIFLALTQHAEVIGNLKLIDTLTKVASQRGTRFGQEIEILKHADPLNIVNQKTSIEIARENLITKKTGKTPVKAKADISKEIDTIIKEERTLAQLKVAEAEKLLDSIVC